MESNIEKKYSSKVAQLEQLYQEKKRIEQRIFELQHSRIKPHEIVSLAANLFKINYSELISEKRDHELVCVRQIVSKAMKDRGYTLQEIGSELTRHHGTIMHGLTEYKLRYKRPGFEKFTEMADQFVFILETYEKTMNL